MRHDNCRSGDERGTVLVEMAMVIPLVLALLLGIFTGGSAYFKKISLVDAARDAGRYGASLKVPVGGITVWRQEVVDRVVQLAGGTVSPADVCVDLVTPTKPPAAPDTTCGVTDPTNAYSDPTVLTPASIVKIGVTQTTRLEFIFFTSTPTLSARVAARYERDII